MARMIMPVAMLHRRAVGRLAVIVHDRLDHHVARLLEGQRHREGLPVFQRLRQPHQHHMVAAALQRVHLARGQGDAALDLAHLHHAIGILDMGVQPHPRGHIRTRRDQAVIGGRVVVNHEEDRARATRLPVAAGIDIVDMQAFGMLLRRQRQRQG